MYTDFAGRHVAHQLEAQHVERHALGRQHPLGAFGVSRWPSTSGRMPLRIAEAQQAVADDHGDDRIAAAAAAIHGADGGEDVRGRDARRAHALQLRGEHVEQHFGIGTGVEMAAVFALEDLGRARARW